jgi:hypothetical protein
MNKVYNIVYTHIGQILAQEMEDYSEFLYENNIGVLPDGFYLKGKKLDYGEVRRLYDEWCKSRDKN